MELFKNTNFDFLGWKWPFIGASLVLWAAGMISLIVHGGPRYGIDFKGGAEMRLRFMAEPPMARLRSVLDAKVPGSSLQQLNGAQEVEVTTPITNEAQLNANRQVIEDTLRQEFADTSGKLDLNNSSVEELSNKLRDPLIQAGALLSEQQLQDVSKAIEDYRANKGGLVRSFDELSGVPGVTAQVIAALKNQCVLGPFTILSTDLVGPKIGADLQKQAIQATLFALGGMLIYIWFRFEWVYGLGAVIAVFHDTLITLGLFSLLNKEIADGGGCAADPGRLSMNDTIGVRPIRENRICCGGRN
jgi:preprotein translocase subunit SecF